MENNHDRIVHTLQNPDFLQDFFKIKSKIGGLALKY